MGRGSLVKSVLTSQVIYHATPLIIPPPIIKSINKIERAFLWAGTDKITGAKCKLIDGADFSEDKVEATLQLPLNKKNGAQQIAAFLVLLRAKGETYEEIVGLAKAMMRNCVRVEGLHDAVDIVGTGSDGIGTVNISTGSTILAAGA
ncbi:Anthranilate phosphoribosyltransferase, chloroplastic [Triticum urartu]|uniref:Anthranilate phosphoribosyltransferase, chloroplastic n=1 Tax=Triticum urartu TaxID=4572 RepID=M7ZYK2_TRIUA|nr:Anthranilate phosphoribosyltransferase, chloroplastic [Triticum urartu]